MTPHRIILDSIRRAALSSGHPPRSTAPVPTFVHIFSLVFPPKVHGAETHHVAFAYAGATQCIDDAHACETPDRFRARCVGLQREHLNQDDRLLSRHAPGFALTLDREAGATLLRTQHLQVRIGLRHRLVLPNALQTLERHTRELRGADTSGGRDECAVAPQLLGEGDKLRTALFGFRHVHLVECDDLRPSPEIGDVRVEFGVDDRDVVRRIRLRCVNDVDQQPRALDMPQEFEPEAGPLSAERRNAIMAEVRTETLAKLDLIFEQDKKRIKNLEVILIILGTFLNGFGDYIVGVLKSYVT